MNTAESREAWQRRFEAWKREADKTCYASVGLACDDLPDVVSAADAFDRGQKPSAYARTLIRAAKRDMGM